MPEPSIGFYGHVKQYHNLKSEIDQARQQRTSETKTDEPHSSELLDRLKQYFSFI